jgi:hypothetical protein
MERVASLKLLPNGVWIPHNVGYPRKEESMSRQSLEELVRAWRPRYLRANRKEKTRILDEFVALTDYHRKSAIRLLRNGMKPKVMDKRGRPRVYTPDVKAALLQVWEACGQICSKRLAPFLPEIVAVLEREGELKLPPDTKRLLVRMSAATIDRLLRTHRPKRPRSRCTTKPGTLLKEKIPVRTFADCKPRGQTLTFELFCYCKTCQRGVESKIKV